MLYNLKLYSAVCQLYLTKTGRKKSSHKKEVSKKRKKKSEYIPWNTIH